MEDTRRLLPAAPGRDIELQERLPGPSDTQSHGRKPETESLVLKLWHLMYRKTSRLHSPKTFHQIWTLMFVFFVFALGFMGGHWGFFKRLDGTPAKRQGLQTAMSNIFAVFVDIFLLGGLRVPSKTTISDQSAGKQLGHSGGPRSSWSRKLFSKGTYNRVASLVCFAIPFALIFPPGGVTTEFENLHKESLSDVKTMNISDIGNGTIRSFVEHSLFQMHADLNYNPTQPRPQLRAMAAQVLASGEPVRFDSPCNGSCIYNISLEGPTFHCEEAKAPKCLSYSPIYEAQDMGNPHMSPIRFDLRNNAFNITWDPKPDPNDCDQKSRRSLICRMKLSTYTLEIEYSRNASRSIKTKVDKHRDVWTNSSRIQNEFYHYFFNGTSGHQRPQPIRLDELHANFSNSQAFAIRQAAIGALQGIIIFDSDGDARYFNGNASQVLGSPYIGLNNRYEPKFYISAGSIERFLQDVVISTLSIGMSTHEGGIEAMVGTDVYRFNEREQFFFPYGVSAVVALFINAYGAYCWHKDKSTAGSSKGLDEVRQEW